MGDDTRRGIDSSHASWYALYHGIVESPLPNSTTYESIGIDSPGVRGSGWRERDSDRRMGVAQNGVLHMAVVQLYNLLVPVARVRR